MKGNDKQGEISHKLTYSEYGGRNIVMKQKVKIVQMEFYAYFLVLLEQIKERWQKKYGLMFWLVSESRKYFQLKLVSITQICLI